MLLHLKLTDTQARIISLLIYGLEYFEIELFWGTAVKTVSNNVNMVVGKLELSGSFHLFHLARSKGFDNHGHVNLIVLFSPGDLSRLHKKFPLSRRIKEQQKAA